MPTSRAARREPGGLRGASGFTLLELLVVLVLLAAMAMLVLPRLGPSTPPAGDRLQLEASLEALRRQAIFAGRPLVVDPEGLAGAAGRLEWTPASGTGPGLWFAPDGGSNGGWLRLPDGSRLVIGPFGEIRRDDG
jgi:prepilin-type N-terminal cleavage/methylation domain-containing protein